MVSETKKNGETVYQCDECKLFYAEKEWAKKCETWCQGNNSCNLEIIKHAIKKEE